MEGRERYPLSLVILKWITGILEIGGGIFILMNYHLLIGILYGAYAAFAGALILPLASCVSCHYYGKRCHCGMGFVSSRLHKKDTNDSFAGKFPWRILIFPVWLVPLLGALVILGRARNLFSIIMVAVYILLIYFHHRILMKRPACKSCMQREQCPGCQYKEYITLT
ncbi:MAG: hypothetical protein GY855_05970 [candidate division Zixibacteria bacterium]|nr:hypothetical protein [candidate division Zixibacteria bacterium]